MIWQIQLNRIKKLFDEFIQNIEVKKYIIEDINIKAHFNINEEGKKIDTRKRTIVLNYEIKNE